MGAASKWPYIMGALVLYAIAFYLYFPLAPAHPYLYDEADYMWAGRQGFWANYAEPTALPFTQFVRKGLELSRDPSKRSSFSQFIRSTGDIGLYRHYHGPTYAYWLSFLQNIGVTREQIFRGSGMFIHLITGTLILFGFWALFPALPPLAGLVAFALFVFSRTTLVAAMAITQHGLFTLLCVTTLFAAGFFFNTLNPRWLYATMASIAVAFCTVETSALLVAAFVIALLIDHRRIREKWPTLKSFAALIVKAIGVFALALMVCWPKGLLQLGIAKGFLTLAYIAIYRKTFSPFTVLDLLQARFVAAPWEFSLLIAGVVFAFVLWRRSGQRHSLLPWLAFIAIFFVIMLKVTVPYTYYYAPLVAAFTVATGVTFGILWNRFGKIGRYLLSLPVLASIIGGTFQFHAVAREIHDTEPYQAAVMGWLHEHPVPPGQQLYLPYQLVPTLHYYYPEMATEGYDIDYPLQPLLQGITSPQSYPAMLCEEPACNILQRNLEGAAGDRVFLHKLGPNGEPLYVLNSITARDRH